MLIRREVFILYSEILFDKSRGLIKEILVKISVFFFSFNLLI